MMPREKNKIPSETEEKRIRYLPYSRVLQKSTAPKKLGRFGRIEGKNLRRDVDEPKTKRRNLGVFP